MSHDSNFEEAVNNDPKFIGFSTAVAQVLKQYTEHIQQIQHERLPVENGKSLAAKHLHTTIEGFILAYIKPAFDGGLISAGEAVARKELVQRACEVCRRYAEDSQAEYLRLDGERRSVQKFAENLRAMHVAKMAEEARKLRTESELQEAAKGPSSLPETVVSEPETVPAPVSKEVLDSTQAPATEVTEKAMPESQDVAESAGIEDSLEGAEGSVVPAVEGDSPVPTMRYASKNNVKKRSRR
jgi:hypothetical protein